MSTDQVAIRNDACHNKYLQHLLLMGWRFRCRTILPIIIAILTCQLILLFFCIFPFLCVVLNANCIIHFLCQNQAIPRLPPFPLVLSLAVLTHRAPECCIRDCLFKGCPHCHHNYLHANCQCEGQNSGEEKYSPLLIRSVISWTLIAGSFSSKASFALSNVCAEGDSP